MKKNIRIIALLLVLVSIMTLMPIEADALTPTYTVSDSYKKSSYYTALKNVELTGNQRTDIVAVARSQLGYTEGNSISQLSGFTNGYGNYTEYGKWFGTQDMWCAMFVSWCANQAQISTGLIKRTASSSDGLKMFQEQNRAYTRAQVSNGTYTPQPGDIIYFRDSGSRNKADHVGIVTGYSGDTVYTIEGNTVRGSYSSNGGGVYEHQYSINSSSIVYICCPNYSNLNISVSSYPVDLEEGQAWGLRGSVTSQYKITRVDGAVYNKGTGQKVMSSVDYPNSTCMDIKYAHVNNDLIFNNLPSGSYNLKITATDSSGKTASWNRDFEVYGRYIGIGMTQYPGDPDHKSIPRGKCFGLRGWINASCKITSIKGEIVKHNWWGQSVVDSTWDYPNSKNFNVRYGNLNNYLDFNRLKKGYYTLRITVTTSCGQTYTWNSDFEVR